MISYLNVVFIIRRIAGVIVSVLALSVVDHRLELRMGQAKEYKGVGMIRVNFGPFSETVYIILNTVIER
jgi:hypothetical protein